MDKGYNGLSVYGSKTVVADGSDTRGLALQIQTEMPKYEELVKLGKLGIARIGR